MVLSRLSARILCAMLLSLFSGARLLGDESPIPRSLVAGISLEKVDGDPNLVTPVSCATGNDGDLFVIESHTHFRPDDYAGPAFDRIWRYPNRSLEVMRPEKANRERWLISDSTMHTMQLAKGPDQSLYVTTRKEVFRIQDPREQVVPRESFDEVLRLETKADYPHNGLSGIAVDASDWLYVGIGENFGDTYHLMDRHGNGIQGGGEGGSIFRCHLDGTHLERIATGFWNPFALCFDPAGRLWVVDNDPDASPPCRLIHVIPGGDYGFQFRFGRAGINPLLAWNGDLPGTLGYNSGTGEAPSGIVFHRGYLWVTSWGDNCVERYRLHESDGMIKGMREIVIQGGPDFRPVGLAIGRNGELWISDWVDRSYTLHNRGALWKLTFSESDPSPAPLMRSPAESRAASLSQNDPMWSHSDGQSLAASQLECEKALGDPDLRIRVAAEWGLGRIVTPQGLLEALDRLESPRARVSLLHAARWPDLDRPSKIDPALRRAFCQKGLRDRDEDVRMAAVRWVAETKDHELLADVSALLENPQMAIRECRVVLAALDFLELAESDLVGAVSGGRHAALKIVHNPQRPKKLRAIALQMINPSDAGFTSEKLFELAHEGDPLGREAARSLALSSAPDRFEYLQRLVTERALDAQLRADAMMGLAAQSPLDAALLQTLSGDPDVAVQVEAQRILRHALPANAPNTPAPHRDLPTLMEITEDVGSLDAGWRVFFRAHGGKCASCHTFQHRGANVGPDLSTLASSPSRLKLLESLVDPSREIAPLYVPWQIATIDGRVLSGIKLHIPGADDKTRYLASDGTIFELALTEIERQSPLAQSIMPSGLCDMLEEQELRDLVTLLTTHADSPPPGLTPP
jgi:putative membrane-bound dehydrogenase-like protein